MIVSSRGDADAAGCCDTLKPRRDIDVIAKDIVRFDDYITNVDAHPKSDSPIFRLAGGKFADARLELHCSPNRFDGTRKFCQEPVARMRPPCSVIAGWPLARSAISLECVASSSSCISCEYPDTSAASIADNLRSIRTGPSRIMSNKSCLSRLYAASPAATNLLRISG